jgi:hypothetical protein
MMPVTKIAATVPLRAAGVTYLTVPDLPGVAMFRCEKLRATMSFQSCAARWRLQRNADFERADACSGCAIGAAHSGVEPDHRSKIFGWPICPRCRRRSIRMIGNRRCVNCYNREQEFGWGRNSRGTKPRLILKPARIGLVINAGDADEIAIDIAERLTLDCVEIAIGAMRVVDGRVAITRPQGGRAIDLAELARRHGPRRPPRKPIPRRHARTRAAA